MRTTPNLFGLLAVLATAQAQTTASCSSTLNVDYPAPSLAEGYTARLVANDLESPRGIKFDSEGHLLVVEQEVGITALTLSDPDDGCVSTTSRKTVIEDESLNHGIELSEDGSLLYASSADAVYRWEYDASTQELMGDPQTLVTNMTNSDHTTRTLLLSRSAPGMLVVTRGSTSNIDPLASDISTGHSQIKAFNITNLTTTTPPYQFQADGVLLGWGLRNEVGIAEEPTTGGIFGVENSVDEMMRDGEDIHLTNPAEELNFLGFLNDTASMDSSAAPNFGYPECYTAWNTTTIPNFSGSVGDAFAIGPSSGDQQCSQRTPATLGFHPHMAPLDILFNPSGSAAWISFHGSWNSEPPVGYKVSVVAFADGMPTVESTSLEGAVDVFSNADVERCGEAECFRPVGLAWDAEGRLFVSSDATGEIYMISRVDDGMVSEGEVPESGGGSEGSGSGGGSGSGSGSEGDGGGDEGGAGTASMSVLAVILGILAFLT